jgi:hypothetical protein
LPSRSWCWPASRRESPFVRHALVCTRRSADRMLATDRTVLRVGLRPLGLTPNGAAARGQRAALMRAGRAAKLHESCHEALHLASFPVCHRIREFKFAVRVCKFPVRTRREFPEKGNDGTALSSSDALRIGAKSRDFPLFSRRSGKLPVESSLRQTAPSPKESAPSAVVRTVCSPPSPL